MCKSIGVVVGGPRRTTVGYIGGTAGSPCLKYVSVSKGVRLSVCA